MLPKRLQNIIVLLSTSIQDLIGEIKDYFEQQLAQKDARIRELEDQLAKNSQNSSKPPSTDTPYAKPDSKSRRTKTKRKIGGQKKHKGSNLKQVETPDFTVVHKVTACSGCGKDLSSCSVKSIRRHQVYDFPPLKLEVTEHQGEVKKCSCRHTTKADFPLGASHYVQYGSNIKGFLT